MGVVFGQLSPEIQVKIIHGKQNWECLKFMKINSKIFLDITLTSEEKPNVSNTTNSTPYRTSNIICRKIVDIWRPGRWLSINLMLSTLSDTLLAFSCKEHSSCDRFLERVVESTDPVVVYVLQ